MSKWVEAIPFKANDHKVVLKFLKDNIFSRFGVPKGITSTYAYLRISISSVTPAGDLNKYKSAISTSMCISLLY